MNTSLSLRGSEIVDVMNDASVLGRFMDAMDKAAVRPFVQSVLLVVAGRPELRVCTPESIVTSALEIALLRLSVEPTLGHAYLVPFRERGVAKCQKIVGYKGLEQLAIRTGMYTALNRGQVFEGETVTVERLSGRVSISGTMTKPRVIGRFGYFEMTDGFSKTVYMTVEEIHTHARTFSKGYANPGSPWHDPRFVGAMEAKTPFRMALLQYGYLDPFDLGLVKSEESGEQKAESSGQTVDSGRWTVVVDAEGAQNAEGGRQKAEGGPVERTAAELRDFVKQKAGEFGMRGKVEAAADVRARLVRLLDECFAPDPNAGLKRMDVCEYLTGYRTVEKMPGVSVLALVWWLGRVEEGRTVLDARAAGEARMVWGEGKGKAEGRR